MNANAQKYVGLGMMVPFAALSIYVVLSLKLWLIAIGMIVFGALALVGYNMVKGMTPKEAIKDVIDDAKKVEDKIKN